MTRCPFHALRGALTGTLLAVLMVVLAGCSGAGQASDPMVTLAKPRMSPGTHIDAMSRLDGANPNPAYLKQLKKIVISNTYLMQTRKAAFARLAKYDSKLLESALANTLMHLSPVEYRVWVIEQVGLKKQRGLTKALIRSWAIPLEFWERDTIRPEPVALAAIHGEDKVQLTLMSTMLDANPVIESNLRARCWELLVANGSTDSLLVLIQDDQLVGNDGLLLDMRAAIDDLHVIPRNREEILWIRALRMPEHADYWKKVSAALVQLDDERRQNLEPRDLAVAVAAAEHRPELLRSSNKELYDVLDKELRGSGRRYTADFSGWTVNISEKLHDSKGKLTWGDLAAMLLAREALQSEMVRAHIFDYAERDLLDTSTEYGGIIRLDEKGRFEIVEHVPRARVADDRYLASQKLFDEGYTALFHFHNHAQKYRNYRYAGPHLGDIDYANETGVNGLVFTFVDPETMNVDFYRHGAIIVDLGTIKRPGAE